ncbi:hypothetical protein SBA6_60079 [Candidatus Sulfopaludibacter sp. SbA6]|nr:hypothetical protein SBA6_60079 [Candidatus Sulfopaludibacter sp. SbA6]
MQLSRNFLFLRRFFELGLITSSVPRNHFVELRRRGIRLPWDAVNEFLVSIGESPLLRRDGGQRGWNVVLDPCERALDQFDPVIGAEQLGWGAVVQERQWRRQPVGRVLLVAEYCDGVGNHRDQTSDRSRGRHQPYSTASSLESGGA